MSAPEFLIVTDALVANAAVLEDGGYLLHPSLQPWQNQLEKCSTRWFESRPQSAIEWYAAVAERDVASLLSSALDKNELEGFSQFWIASPFHARLIRDRLQVMPDAYFAWSESDAVWLCDLLNPLLNEEGMNLIRHQASPVLLCRNVLDAAPLSFAAISGHTLPNRHPEGADGGALMRLTAEIQMMLNQYPSDSRRAAGEPDVDGLWLWGGGLIKSASGINPVPVATRNPLLRSVVDAKGAVVVISEAERLPDLIKEGQALPKRIVLAGGDHALLMSKALLPKFGKPSWTPKRVSAESDLVRSMRESIHAA